MENKDGLDSTNDGKKDNDNSNEMEEQFNKNKVNIQNSDFEFKRVVYISLLFIFLLSVLLYTYEPYEFEDDLLKIYNNTCCIENGNKCITDGVICEQIFKIKLWNKCCYRYGSFETNITQNYCNLTCFME